MAPPPDPSTLSPAAKEALIAALLARIDEMDARVEALEIARRRTVARLDAIRLTLQGAPLPVPTEPTSSPVQGVEQLRPPAMARVTYRAKLGGCRWGHSALNLAARRR